MGAGSDVVGAATIAPVGSYVSSLSASAERSTISRQRPVYVHAEAQRRQYATVASRCSRADRTSAGTIGPRHSPAPSAQRSSKAAHSPARRSNSAPAPPPAAPAPGSADIGTVAASVSVAPGPSNTAPAAD